jgi:sorbitol-specific phosphotransferase system component IIA
VQNSGTVTFMRGGQQYFAIKSLDGDCNGSVATVFAINGVTSTDLTEAACIDEDGGHSSGNLRGGRYFTLGGQDYLYLLLGSDVEW